ncbi:stress response regulator SrrA [Histoplasma capsulatum var. duboisii H88]|uniref:Transcription factor n=1 Tax=Ajellomyces capsulatus (strain H88) TaxID=544711 RepID=F0U7T1_AJEC8|nr:stress response regulator SrrA [Histoplasma capsulatum var. duboisii H88]QSS51148.1 stress response regulator SrrA [Histoplasma capsulatum var. duboisii H88]
MALESSTPTGGGAPAGNSSDFVRKLYKMLEDPSYSQIVRWGDDNDSFVVLECEKFTKSILPKHFKHSNFASFVRQLNKYDFHKVRQNNEESGQSPYGPNAWEFKHPEFKANNKESLDNIRRKAPAPRKPAQLNEETFHTQQFDMLNQQLVAQAQQFQQLSDRFSQLALENQMMQTEVRRVQKSMLSHEQVLHYMMNYLHGVDARHRRESRTQVSFQGTTGPDLSPSQVAPAEEEAASPLQQASKILSELSNEIQMNLGSLESMTDIQSRLPGAAPTPPLDQTQRNGTIRPPTSSGSTSSLGYSKLNGELEQLVYPVGAPNGIEPLYSEHVNNIPYSFPPKELDPNDPRRQYVDGRKKSMYVNPGWVQPPRILLVEDDQTCRQVGGKFLLSFCCTVDYALDGLEAVNKIQEGSKYDLILMDIIMPNLDGVSACSVIRRVDTTPIIAMTSNIRSSDIELYFQHGMNDVLPKPFTRQSLLTVLERHLNHLKTIPNTMEAPQSAIIAPIAQNSAAQSVKDENSPGQSPAASMNNWQSPGQFQGMSPITPSVPSQYMQQQTPTTAAAAAAYALDQNGVQFPHPQPQLSTMNPTAATASRVQNRRQMSDIAGAADGNSFPKRQKIFTHNTQTVVNPMQTNRIT